MQTLNFRYEFDSGLVISLTQRNKVFMNAMKIEFHFSTGFFLPREELLRSMGEGENLVLERSQCMSKFHFLTYMGQKCNAQNVNLPPSLWTCEVKTNSHYITILNSTGVWKLWP